MTEFGRRWDLRFIHLAVHIALWSKDPSTKCGAVIVRPNKTIAGVGYNGFPRKIPDAPETLDNREQKYKLIVHAEINAILNANEPVQGYTLYTYPFSTCHACSLLVIQSGIATVAFPEETEEQRKRWGESFDMAARNYQWANVNVERVKEI